MHAAEGTALAAGKEGWRTGAFYEYKTAGPKHQETQENQFPRHKLADSTCLAHHACAGGRTGAFYKRETTHAENTHNN